MNVKSLKSQLFAAVVMMLVACVALGSSTYAWFAMNNKVTATGMSVTTQVSNNLFIAPKNTTQTTISGDSEFKTSLVTTIAGLLEPVSTVNGVDFFYTETNKVLPSGDAASEDYKDYEEFGLSNEDVTGYANKFSQNYGVKSEVGTAYGYVDYAFQLKAINTQSTPKELKLTKLNLTYGDADEKDGHKAFRAGVFILDESGNAYPNFATKSAADAIFAYDTSTNTNFTAGKAVNSANTLDNVTYNGTLNTTVPGNTTKYYYVVVRLWLEGEDKLCKNDTFAALTDNWNLDVGFELDTETTAVSKLTTAAVSGKVSLASAILDSETIIVGSVTYTKIKDITLGGKALYCNTAPLSESSHIFVIEDNMYPIDVTNQCALTNP